MSGRLWSFQCRACGSELGIVEDGQLFNRPSVTVRVDRQGTVWLRCSAIDARGRLCNQERGWTLRGRGAVSAVLELV